MLDTLVQSLRAAAAAEPPFGCCLLYGEERYPYEFLNRGLTRLVELDHTIETYDAASITLPEFLASVSAPSLFARRKIVHLKNSHNYQKKDLEKLLKWLETQTVLDPESVVVTYLFMSASGLDGRSRLVSRLKKNKFKVVKSDKLKPYEVEGRLKKRVQAADIAIDGQVLNALVHLHEANLTLLEQEVDKMMLYVGPKGCIDHKVVDLLGIDGGGGNVFTFGDALSEGRLVDALIILDILKRARTESILIIAMISRQFRLLSRIGSPEVSRLSPADMAKVLKVPNFVVKKLVRQVKRWSAPGCAEVLTVLHDADIALKSSQLPKEIILERVVLKIAALR